ncbi:MAG TPA: ATP-dependent sacrificial sulfur transferase LarE [Nitrospiria bacterium]
MKLEVKHKNLRKILKDMGSVVVAFSGGADSALVLKVAHDVLERKAVAATGVSPAVAVAEVEESRRVARLIGITHHVITSDPMENPVYRENGPGRCYACKETLYLRISELAKRLEFRFLANGTNQDDLRDFRPGLEAAKNFGVRSPLLEAGFNKKEIRELSRKLDLPTWDKPADACLSSRIPFGTPISEETLGKVEKAERFLKEEGFRLVRVRNHSEMARIEIPTEDFNRFLEPGRRNRIVQNLKKLGFRQITLDVQGYRQGSMNPEEKS